MAKLADAHASEACSRKGLKVQILFPALERRLFPFLKEGWQSGPLRGIANPMSSNARTGSNPVPSATAVFLPIEHILLNGYNWQDMYELKANG